LTLLDDIFVEGSGVQRSEDVGTGGQFPPISPDLVDSGEGNRNINALTVKIICGVVNDQHVFDTIK
jgi:hypothetical protein